VLAALLFIIAILATGAAIFQIAARLGAFGLGVRDVAARNPHVASNIVLTAILWVTWCYLGSKPNKAADSRHWSRGTLRQEMGHLPTSPALLSEVGSAPPNPLFHSVANSILSGASA
jgi:hypothetical protein